MHRMPKQLNAAFSLLELAIVLTIIGLLAGGVLTGQEMIHSAQLQKTIKQMRDIDQATIAFRDQYGGYPGDIKNATSFWATAANGDGDGMIEANDATHDCSTAFGEQSTELDCTYFVGERAQFFTQLGLAGLYNKYDGSTTLGVGYPSIPLNQGMGMIVGSAWILADSSNMKIENYVSPSVYLYLGVCNPSKLNANGAFNDCGTLIPIDAQNIDSKIDDGKPLSGTVFGQSFNTICATGTAANTTSVTATNSYDLRSKNPGCNLIFNLGE